MKKLMVLLASLLIANVAFSQEAMLCHTSSSGFYATDGEKGILLDALYADGLEGYEQASDDLNRKMENAEGQFADVRIVYASHYHGDHMTGEAVLKHLRANKEAAAFITEQAANTIVPQAGATEEDYAQITSFKIPIGEKRELTATPFPVTLFGISHGEGRPIENIGIAVTVAGKTIMHVGDMFAKEEDLIKAGATNVNPDFLLMPIWYLMEKEDASEINRIFEPKAIVPMHIPPPDGADIRGSDEQAELVRTVHHIAENIVRLDEEMQCIALD